MTEAQKAAAADGDLFYNERFSFFRDLLEKKGFHLKLLWSANSGAHNAATGKRFKYDNLGCFVVMSSEHRPAVSTLIAVSYGGNGCGIWLESGNDMTDDLRLIAGDYVWKEPHGLGEPVRVIGAAS